MSEHDEDMPEAVDAIAAVQAASDLIEASIYRMAAEQRHNLESLLRHSMIDPLRRGVLVVQDDSVEPVKWGADAAPMLLVRTWIFMSPNVPQGHYFVMQRSTFEEQGGTVPGP